MLAITQNTSLISLRLKMGLLSSSISSSACGHRGWYTFSCFKVLLPIPVAPSGIALRSVSGWWTILCIQHTFVLIIILVWKRRVRHVGLRSTLDPCLAASAKFFLEQDHVPRVALVRRVGKITNEWNETDHKIDKDVDLHARLDGGRQFGLDRAACAIDHESK